MITLEEAKQDIKRAIAEKGEDYVYPFDDREYVNEYGDCQYRKTNSDEPACIVGHALYYRGMLNRVVEGYSFQASGVADLYKKDAKKFMGFVQIGQDYGFTWGEAYKVAEENMGIDTVINYRLFLEDNYPNKAQ